MQIPSKYKESSRQSEITSQVEIKVACSKVGKIPYYFVSEVQKECQQRAVWQDKVKAFSIEFSKNHPLVSYGFFKELLR